MRRGAGIADADIEAIVKALQTIDCDSAWERVLKIGETVFDRLTNGNETEWHSHRSSKNVSLRRIAETPGCPFRKSALSSAVGVYLFTRAHDAVTKLTTIKPTHVASVVTLDGDRAVVLLTEAAERGWSVRELSSRVRMLRKEQGEKRGRPASSAFRRVETLLRNAVGTLTTASRMIENCGAIAPEELENLRRLLDEVDNLTNGLRLNSGLGTHGRERAHAA